MIEKLYTVEEVAQLASVTGRTIRNYLKSGRLKGRKIGGQWRFPESEVQRLLTGGEDAAAYPAEQPAPQQEYAPAQLQKPGQPVIEQQPVYQPVTAATAVQPTAQAAQYTTPTSQPIAQPVAAPVQPPVQQVPVTQTVAPQAPVQNPAPVPSVAAASIPGTAPGYVPPAPLPSAPSPATGVPHSGTEFQNYYGSPTAPVQEYVAPTAPPVYEQPAPYMPPVQEPAPEPRQPVQPQRLTAEPKAPVVEPEIIPAPAAEAPVTKPDKTAPPVPVVPHEPIEPLAEELPAAPDEDAPLSTNAPSPVDQLSDVGLEVVRFVSEVHDCSAGPQICAVVELNQTLEAARHTSAQLGLIAEQESASGIPCQSYVEYDERYSVARYTLFGSSLFLARGLQLIG